MDQQASDRPQDSRLLGNQAARTALILLLGLTILRILIPQIPVPLAALPVASIVTSMVFVLVPVTILFFGSSLPWTGIKAAIAIAVGAALQFGLMPFLKPGMVGMVLGAVAQGGLLVWCLGLGVGIALLVRERNMLVPIAIFLALFDIWLVFVPEGPVGQVARANGSALTSVAFQVPRPVNAPTTGRAVPLAYVGPADFLFISMFFAALHRFKLQVVRTAKLMVPVLVCYLLITLLFGQIALGPIQLGALPALLPIGAVILIANYREFKLTAEERQTTIALTVICTGILIWRFIANREVEQPEPSPTEAGQEAPAPTKKHAPRHLD